jgi:hypothetical protein
MKSKLSACMATSRCQVCVIVALIYSPPQQVMGTGPAAQARPLLARLSLSLSFMLAVTTTHLPLRYSQTADSAGGSSSAVLSRRQNSFLVAV